MGVDLVTQRGRIGSFNGKWTNMVASWTWEKGCGMKKCSLSLCFAMSFILICGMDIETNPGPMQTKLASFEQKDKRNTKEGFNGRFDQTEHKLESVASKKENTIIEEQTKMKAENEKLTKQVKDFEEKVIPGASIEKK